MLVRQDGWLRYYRYTWAAAGIGLLLLVFLLGDEVNGARLSLTIGPFTGQPSELLKVILVVFLAAYLADNRQLLAGQSWRVGPVSLPPLPYLLPMLGMWGIAMAVVIIQKDLGAALLFFSVSSSASSTWPPGASRSCSSGPGHVRDRQRGAL